MEGLSPGRCSRASSVTRANTTLAPPSSRTLAEKSRATNGLLAHAHACAGNTRAFSVSRDRMHAAPPAAGGVVTRSGARVHAVAAAALAGGVVTHDGALLP